MALLFSYGTLQLEHVQLATFGRKLDGQKDKLFGFEAASVRIADAKLAEKLGMTHHANIVRTDNGSSRVAGTALEVTDAELSMADAYEAPVAYARIEVDLASGRKAWVYVHKGSEIT